jgi:G3E family GTPase
MDRIPVVIINGFLGSGKTTLLKNLLAQSYHKQLNVSVIVNDMSELDVDGVLIEDMDIVEEKLHNFVSISADSISSKTGIKKLQQALADMLSHLQPDLIIIETSGSSHPLPLIEFFRSQTEFSLIGVLILADSRMLDSDYNCGQQLIPKFQQNLQTGKRDTVNLLAEQIMFCSHLLLSKVDLLAEGKLETIAKAIHPLNPYVSIFSVSYGQLSIDEILAMPEYDYYRVDQLIQELKPILDAEPSDSRPYNMATSVIKDDRPFHPQRLWDVCHKYLGQAIYRSKGFFWLPGRDTMALLWNQSAGNIELQITGYWRAGILEDENNGLDDIEKDTLKEKLSKETGRFGDRHCHLTVIGDRSQVNLFTEALKQCFLTDNEIKYWKSGGTFLDPWPKRLVKL